MRLFLAMSTKARSTKRQNSPNT